MEERIAETTAGTRWNSLASALFAGLALVLAMVGIYGVISYSTARRTKEIGVRMALGAQGEDITRWIVREAAVMALAGIGLGLAGYFALARVLRRLLYGTSAMDPATIAGAAALLATIAILASYIPARRAARIDPNHALREE